MPKSKPTPNLKPKIVLTKFNPKKHDVEGFEFSSWSASHIVLDADGDIVAVLTKAPKCATVGGQIDSKRFKTDGKRMGPVYAIRVMNDKGKTTVVGWPDTLDEAREALAKILV